MEALAAFNTTPLLAVGRLLLRKRDLGMAAIATSDLPEEVKQAITREFGDGSSNKEAISRLKQGDAEVVRAAGGILDWLQHSNVERQRREDY